MNARIHQTDTFGDWNRLNENIRLLKMHRDKVRSAGGVEMPLQADILTLRLGGENDHHCFHCTFLVHVEKWTNISIS